MTNKNSFVTKKLLDFVKWIVQQCFLFFVSMLLSHIYICQQCKILIDFSKKLYDITMNNFRSNQSQKLLTAFVRVCHVKIQSMFTQWKIFYVHNFLLRLNIHQTRTHKIGDRLMDQYCVVKLWTRWRKQNFWK